MAVVKISQSLQINVGSSWSCKLMTTMPIEDHNPNWRFEYGIQVKFTVQEGYNHDSIVTSLIAKETNCNLGRKAKKWNEAETIQNFHVMQQK